MKIEDTVGQIRNIARIAKAASHKLPGKSSLNVSFVLSCPVHQDHPVHHDHHDRHDQTTKITMTTMIMDTRMTMANMRNLQFI